MSTYISDSGKCSLSLQAFDLPESTPDVMYPFAFNDISRSFPGRFYHNMGAIFIVITSKERAISMLNHFILQGLSIVND